MMSLLESTRLSDFTNFSLVISDVARSFENLLADMAVADDRWMPPKDERTPGWYAKFQVRCVGCGKFAKTLRAGDGYDSLDGSYDPWWRVDCKRCGVTDGKIYCD